MCMWLCVNGCCMSMFLWCMFGYAHTCTHVCGSPSWIWVVPQSLSLSLSETQIFPYPGSHPSILASPPVSPRGPLASPPQCWEEHSAEPGFSWLWLWLWSRECWRSELRPSCGMTRTWPTASFPDLQITMFLRSLSLNIHKTSQNIPMVRALLLRRCSHENRPDAS